jgi:glutamate dehydrogenase
VSDPAAQPPADPAPSSIHPTLVALYAEIESSAPPERRDALLTFARMFLRRMTVEELETRSVAHLLGTVLSAFRFVDGRGNHPAAVRVIAPTTEADGYEVPGTVIETNSDDSPFLVDSVTEELNARNLSVRLLLHPMLGTHRAEDGRLERVLSSRDASHRESLMHFELDRRLSAAARE